MGEEVSDGGDGGVPLEVFFVVGGFISLMCCVGCSMNYLVRKCQEQGERIVNEKKEKLWANAQVVQPPIAYQNQRKSYQFYVWRTNGRI